MDTGYPALIADLEPTRGEVLRDIPVSNWGSGEVTSHPDPLTSHETPQKS